MVGGCSVCFGQTQWFIVFSKTAQGTTFPTNASRFVLCLVKYSTLGKKAIHFRQKIMQTILLVFYGHTQQHLKTEIIRQQFRTFAFSKKNLTKSN